MTDRTEAPTPRRLQEAREEGQVARSLELNSAVVMLIGVLLVGFIGRDLSRIIGEEITYLSGELPGISVSEVWIKEMLFRLVVRVLPSLGLLLAGIMVTGVSVTLAQTRFLWSTKKLGFDFKRLDPLSGLKRIFSRRGLVELLRSLLKLGVVGLVAYTYLRSNYSNLLFLSHYDLPTALEQFVAFARDLAIRIGAAYLVLGAADYAYQRWDLMRSLRMTKQEIKEEIKRTEGDPYLKSRIRQQQRRMARARMMSNVPKATVVVTNPTHLAVAIEYNENLNAPRVVAKGAHRLAERIVALAREHGIPVVQNIPLARALFRTIEVDQEISPDLYLAMAEVLAYVYRLRGIKPASQTT